MISGSTVGSKLEITMVFAHCAVHAASLSFFEHHPSYYGTF